MVDTVVVQTPEAGFEAPESGTTPGAATPEATNERPSWLPEKFKTPEELAASYAALEAKLGAPKEEQPASTEETKPAEDSAENTDASQEETEDAPAVNAIEAAQAEFAEKGELSEASYETLAKAGYPKDIVDRYIEGQKALAATVTKQLNDAAGGEEQFQKMATWASTNLPADKITELNKAFDSADVNTAVMAVETLKTAYEEANGVTPKLVSGSKVGSSADVYESWAQVTADMGKPEYASDPAFRAKVEAKLARSNI